MHERALERQSADERLAPPPAMTRLLADLCDEIGAELTLDPEFGFAGAIRFADGRRSLFRTTALDINPLGAAQVARDKSAAAALLRDAGLPVPDGVVAFGSVIRDFVERKNPAIGAHLDTWGRIDPFVATHGFPLYVKPNEGEQGRDVFRVADRPALAAAVDTVLARHDRVLVQVPVKGRDIRVVVYDGAVRAAYERRPPQVIGDGRQTMAALASAARPGVLSDVVASRGDEVPAPGACIALSAAANVSGGGRAVALADRLPDSFAALAIRAARVLGLRLAGVDLIAPDIDGAGGGPAVLEVNAAPGLFGYAALGDHAREDVATLYREVLGWLAAHAAP